jgi:hypothetical protein
MIEPNGNTQRKCTGVHAAAALDAATPMYFHTSPRRKVFRRRVNFSIYHRLFKITVQSLHQYLAVGYG